MSRTRLALLKKMAQHLTTWDGTSDHAHQLIEQNTLLLTQLRSMDEELQKDYTNAEQQQVNQFIKTQQELLAVIKKDRKTLLEQMKQLNQKDNIAKNYYSSVKQSIFVDKGM